MPGKITPTDPTKAYVRKARAKRRVGNGHCECGENRPFALNSKTKPIQCFECDRKAKGKNIMDKHHVAGKANSPVTVSVPVNDHRARLSVDQYEWPKQTLQNPHRSPLLAAAACIRGFISTVAYLLESLLSWTAEMMEKLDHYLTERWGEQWWRNTEFQAFVPKVSNARK